MKYDHSEWFAKFFMNISIKKRRREGKYLSIDSDVSWLLKMRGAQSLRKMILRVHRSTLQLLTAFTEVFRNPSQNMFCAPLRPPLAFDYLVNKTKTTNRKTRAFYGLALAFNAAIDSLQMNFTSYRLTTQQISI